MAIESVPQVLSDSIDSKGLSIVTSAKDPDIPKCGSIYDLSLLACGHLVHVHPRTDGSYLAVFKQRWYNAVSSVVLPGYFSAFDEDPAPYWVVIDSQGFLKTDTVEGGVQSFVPYSDSFVRGCYSRSNYLFMVHRRDGNGFVQVHNTMQPITGLTQMIGEEFVPTNDYYIFDMGVYCQESYLVVVGRDSENNLYQARKKWGTVGGFVNKVKDITWEYQNSKGWFTDIDSMEPMKKWNGDYLKSEAPVSFAEYRGSWYISTVVDGYSTLYSLRHHAEGWKTTGILQSLGEVGSTYQGSGSGLYLQPHLPVSSEYLASNNLLGKTLNFPAIFNTYHVSDDDESLKTQWVLLQY